MKVEYLVHFILYVKLNLKDILLKELCMKINRFRAIDTFMWKMHILSYFTIYLGWKTSSGAQISFRWPNCHGFYLIPVYIYVYLIG